MEESTLAMLEYLELPDVCSLRPRINNVRYEETGGCQGQMPRIGCVYFRCTTPRNLHKL